MPGSEFIEALNMPVVVTLVSLLFVIATLLGIFVSWKLSKIDSNVHYLLRAMSENHADHDKLWQAMEDQRKESAITRETVSKIEGKLGA